MDNTKKEWIFIVNPIAGNGFAKTTVPKIEEMIQKHNIDAEIVLLKEEDMPPNYLKNTSKGDSGILLQSGVMVHLMKWQGLLLIKKILQRV